MPSLTLETAEQASNIAGMLPWVETDDEKIEWESTAADMQALRLAMRLAGVPVRMPDDQLKKGPKIYVACLAAYNSGKHHGAWISATKDIDEIWTDINWLLFHSPEPDAEEWAIHDHEDFAGYSVGENPNLEQLNEYAIQIEEHGEAFSLWLMNYGDDNFSDHYMGCYDTEKDFVETQLEEMGVYDQVSKIPGMNPRYVDEEAIAVDWFIESYVSYKGDNGLYVYSR